jgi:hypothetical protein
MSLKTRSGEPCVFLLKLGQKEHLESLRTGLLYMNSLAYFTALEADAARGDPYEGTDSIIQPFDIGEFVFDPRIPGIPPFRSDRAPDGLVGPVRIASNRTSACNIFCLFAVNEPIVAPIFPKSHEWPGNHFILFTNTQALFDRIAFSAKAQGLSVEGRMVEYYDQQKHSGQTGRFRKRSVFSHQREYRLVLEPGRDSPFHFQIGNLSDITSQVTPLELADDVLKFGPEDAIEAGLCW